jgi:hypothetical protein
MVAMVHSMIDVVGSHGKMPEWAARQASPPPTAGTRTLDSTIFGIPGIAVTMTVRHRGRKQVDHDHVGVGHEGALHGHHRMFADERDQEEAGQEAPDDRDEQQAAAIHDPTESNRPFPPPAQPPEGARKTDPHEGDRRVEAWLYHPSSGQAKDAASQIEEEQNLPEQRQPGLQEGASFLAVLGGR